MNSLSWMIYWAGVVGDLKELLCGCAILSAMASVALFIFGLDDFGRKRLLRWLRVSIPAAAVFAFLAVFAPTQNTLYAIAASEYGEEVLKTPEASKARQALNAWLDKQIAKPEK